MNHFSLFEVAWFVCLASYSIFCLLGTGILHSFSGCGLEVEGLKLSLMTLNCRGSDRALSKKLSAKWL